MAPKNNTPFLINVQEGTTSFAETDGGNTIFEPIMVYYKARFSDGWLQWIRRITLEQADKGYSGRW